MIQDQRPLTAGVCGYPIGQSKSPLLFRHWFESYGIRGIYTPLLVAPEDFEQALKTLPKLGFRGVNVTIPHKEIALNLADEATHAARSIGAANTLTFSPDGAIHADNTDGFGFMENLHAAATGWGPARAPAMLLGAGGAARAAIHVLLEAGCPEVRLTNRTRARAEDLAAHFGPRVTVVSWSERASAVAGVGLVANSTSLGMTGQPPLDLGLEEVGPETVVTDMVYNPIETALLAEARHRGLTTVDGLGMLLHQARPGFLRWFGQEPEVTEGLRAACLGSSI